MKVLVTGALGQLGHDVCRELSRRNIAHQGVDMSDFDITDQAASRGYILDYRPEVVIHCSAYTAVDRAEDEPALCHKVNVGGTRNIAEACKEISAKMVYISTDYVFSGTGDTYYDVGDQTGPNSVYGQTKLAGENIVRELLERYFIVRISWAFGVNGQNFVKTMLRIGQERDTVNVVTDQIGSPTYTADLAPLLCDMIMTEKFGTYHATNEGLCSWAEFAEEIFRQAGYATKVQHVQTADYPAKAQRPANSRLSKASLDKGGFGRLPAWQDALARYIGQRK